MSSPSRPFSFIAAIVIVFAASPEATFAAAPALAERADMLDRFYRGRAIVNEAVAAVGGAEALRAMTGVSFTARGDTYNDVQGFSADRIGRPDSDGRLTVVNNFDFAKARYAQRTMQELAGGFGLDGGLIWNEGTTFALRNIGKEYVATPNSPPPTSPGGLVMLVARWSPPMLLQKAAQNFRSIAYLGDGAVGDVAAEIVEFSFDEITRMRLFVSKADRRVLRVEVIAPDAIAADDVSAVDFSGEQVVGGLKFPAGFVGYRRGARTFEMAIENVAVNPAFDEALFAPPADYKIVADDKPTTTEIAQGVYEVSGLGGGTYRSQFVVMNDFVVAFEAPLGLAVSRQIIGEVRKVAGEKPIKYVVVSHFHSDHAGGVGAYADIGATIVSAAENRDVLTAYARARSQSQGQGGVLASLDVKFEPVTGDGFEIADSTGRTLEIIAFKTPHVERLLALYDPQSRVIINGDLFSRLVRWNATFDVFARWLRRSDAPPADLILGTHHEPISPDDLLAVARDSRRRK